MTKKEIMEIGEKYCGNDVDKKLGIDVKKRATCFYVARAAFLFGSEIPIGVGSTAEKARANLLLNLMQYDDLYGSQVDHLLFHKTQQFIMGS